MRFDALMRLHVEVCGQGECPAVLLHGMISPRESWWRVVPLLIASGHRALAVDPPGHGLSPRDDTLTVDRAARAIAVSVADECGSVPDLVMGHSYGGSLLPAPVQRARLT